MALSLKARRLPKGYDASHSSLIVMRHGKPTTSSSGVLVALALPIIYTGAAATLPIVLRTLHDLPY